MEIGDILEICTIYNDLGTSVQKQFNDIVGAHENGNDDDFEEVLSEQNYNAMDMVIEASESIGNIVRFDNEDLAIKFQDFIDRLRKIMDEE